MNSLAELVPAGAIAIDLHPRNKNELLTAMVDLLALRAPLRATVLKLVEHREREGPTCIGQGFAVPHCRTAGVDRVTMAYGRCVAPIDYGAPDGELVRHVFLIIAPSVDLTHEYLHALAGLARRARTAEFRARLDALTDPGQLQRLLG